MSPILCHEAPVAVLTCPFTLSQLSSPQLHRHPGGPGTHQRHACLKAFAVADLLGDLLSPNPAWLLPWLPSGLSSDVIFLGSPPHLSLARDSALSSSWLLLQSDVIIFTCLVFFSAPLKLPEGKADNVHTFWDRTCVVRLPEQRTTDAGA